MSRKPAKRLLNLMDLDYKGTKVHYALVHSGLDIQASRRAPLTELGSVADIKDHPRLAIAGGIRVTDISKLSAFPLSIIIVGGGITRAKNPVNVAEKLRKAIDSYFKEKKNS